MTPGSDIDPTQEPSPAHPSGLAKRLQDRAKDGTLPEFLKGAEEGLSILANASADDEGFSLDVKTPFPVSRIRITFDVPKKSQPPTKE